jgi:hypothetical protein
MVRTDGVEPCTIPINVSLHREYKTNQRVFNFASPASNQRQVEARPYWIFP